MFEQNNNGRVFRLEHADHYGELYFPLTNESGIMSSVTPKLGGDNKTGQHEYLLEPVSSRDLDQGLKGRNFWCRIKGRGVWSAVGSSAWAQMKKYEEDDHGGHNSDKETAQVTIGRLWHRVNRINQAMGIASEIVSFCPATRETVEIMQVTIKNIGSEDMEFTPTAAVPLYGRSADNIRDHRHVTSLLNRVTIRENGVVLTPALSFDERGHKVNTTSYGVYAAGEGGEWPLGFCPLEKDFIGEAGSLLWPQAVVTDADVFRTEGDYEGYEAIGAIRFADTLLKAGEEKSFVVLLSYNQEGMQYLDTEEVSKAFIENIAYWEKVSNIGCYTGNASFDDWMSWVGIQPTLRRIFGCSFLPHHDYGRGGRGWRDLWQDSLALILAGTEEVKKDLFHYFEGVRIDGSNATIIGRKPGEFAADRNAIVRVWMDHGFWPFFTFRLYLNQTGDYDLLLQKTSYFKDGVVHRGEQKDEAWDGSYNRLQIRSGGEYQGTILEHILVENITVFYDVGEHNHIRLRGADWNDALDMAKEQGESVAFTAAYSDNLLKLAETCKELKKSGITTVLLLKELGVLLNLREEEAVYNSPAAKRELLKAYQTSCEHDISGDQIEVELDVLIRDLAKKAAWIQHHIRKTELVSDGGENFWFNGYYDNHGKKAEGVYQDNVRMMLTSQVFTIMSGTATNDQVMQIIEAVNKYLFQKDLGGCRLNTNFHEMKADLGRMFGFAYGHKENGAVFCHMAVMYAYALYSRGFANEGYVVLQALFEQSMDTKRSRIYPGVPEYFNDQGRGMYSYLTGAGSWTVFTVLTEMFGIKGIGGDLHFEPKLLAKQFDNQGIAKMKCRFAGKELMIQYHNKNRKEIGDYEIGQIELNGTLQPMGKDQVWIGREVLSKLESGKVHTVQVTLE